MLHGKNTRLRAIEKGDLPLLVKWLNDREVTAHLITYRPISEAEQNIWFENVLKSNPDERPLIIEISENNQWIPIGDCEFENIDWRSRCGEVGISIGEKQYWGKGYGTDAFQTLVNYGFEMLNLHRIFLRVYGENLRAIHSYEKIGFVKEGLLREAIYKNGKYLDVVVMSLLQPDWKK